jgi:glutamate N-acetyltransferase/amino-acid N-acetyltransferase
LRDIFLNCAKLIPADGEGATHLLNLHVRGTDTDGQADQIARCVANSALVKCAIHGNDPNWGRIVSAAGYAGVPFDPQTAELRINGHLIFAGGCPQAFNPRELSQSMKSSFDVLIQLSVGSGPGQAVHYTSDLTVDYVKFNSEYTT